VLHAGRLVRAGSAAALQDPDLLGADGSGT
jgi:hypothetical protein